MCYEPDYAHCCQSMVEAVVCARNADFPQCDLVAEVAADNEFVRSIMEDVGFFKAESEDESGVDEKWIKFSLPSQKVEYYNKKLCPFCIC